MTARVGYFATLTLVPVALLAAGGLWGGAWIFAALVYLTALSFAADMLFPAIAEPDRHTGAALPDALSVVLAMAHFAKRPVLLALAVWSISGSGGLDLADRVAAFFAFGLFFGQVSNSNAHELIHRTSKPLFTLGKLVLTSLLFGHHTSAHRLVHHVHVGTAADPNSAPAGQSFYHFAPRAWLGSFTAGWRAERARGASLWRSYGSYIGGAALCIALAGALAGVTGVLVYVTLASYATLQLLMSDYVQHYGLRRGADVNGKTVPVSAAHSWNSPHWFSAFVMLNAPRHSDHHKHPARRYPALELPQDAPMLPYPLPTMGAIALWPARWRRLMDGHLARFSHGAPRPTTGQ